MVWLRQKPEKPIQEEGYDIYEGQQPVWKTG
jgi:hypothetical protein